MALFVSGSFVLENPSAVKKRLQQQNKTDPYLRAGFFKIKFKIPGLTSFAWDDTVIVVPR